MFTQAFVDILKTLIADHGKDTLLNLPICRELLPAYTKNQYGRESRWFLRIMATGIQKEMDASQSFAFDRERYIQVLQDQLFIRPEDAADTVDTLALILQKTGVQKESAAEEDTIAAGEAYRRGFDCYSDGKYDCAIMAFTEAIRLYPDYGYSYLSRADCYRMKGLWDEAIRDCSEAIRLKVDEPLLYLCRGEAYQKKGLPGLAIEDFTEALRLDADDAIAYELRGEAYLLNGQYDEAIRDCDEALRRSPSLFGADVTRAGACRKKGLYGDIIRSE